MNYHTYIVPPEHRPWLYQKANIYPSQVDFVLGVADETDTVKGMIGLYSVSPNITQVHMAFDNPMAFRRAIGPVSKIAFGKTVKYALGVIPGDREKAIRLAEGAGFKEVGRIKDGWQDGVDLVMLLLPRSECRWLDEAERMVA